VQLVAELKQRRVLLLEQEVDDEAKDPVGQDE